MKIVNVEEMASVGFRAPAAYFQKQDPRGSEYGAFRANVVPDTSEEIDVVKHDLEGKRLYRMRFENFKEFSEWAREET